MSSIIEKIKSYDLPPELREAINKQNDLLLAKLSSAADQLKAVGGDRNKLTLQYQELERSNESELASLPWKSVKEANTKGKSFEMTLHDPLTLLKGKTFLGGLLELLGDKGSSDLRVVWASADLDNFKTVNDRWSHAHGDFAIIVACRAIQRAVDEWNRKNGALGHAVAMRFGGDEIVLAIVLKGDQARACESLLDDVHSATCRSLQQRFDFTGLDPKPKDRNGKPIEAKGPAISIGVSSALPCGAGSSTLYTKGFKRADDLLNEYKGMWKSGDTSLGAKPTEGGGVIFEDAILDAKGGEVKKHIDVLSRKGVAGKAMEEAAEALQNLSVNDDNELAIVKEGGLKPLIALLTSGTPVGKEKAAGALRNLSANADNKVAVAKEGGLKPLIALLTSGTPVAKEKAAAALRNLSANEDNEVAIAKEGGLKPLVALLTSGTPLGKEKAAGALLNLSVNNADNMVAIAKQGGLKPLIALLTSGTPVGKEKAAGALANLSVNDDNMVAIAKQGGLKPLIALLTSGTPVGKEMAAAALQNLSFNADNKVAIAEEGGLKPLIALLTSGTPVGKEKAAAALASLSVNDDNELAIAKQGGLKPLIALLTSGTPVGKERAAGALRILSFNADNKVAIVKEGGLKPLIALLTSGTPLAKEIAAAALKNLSGNADIKAAIARAGGPVF